MNINIPDELYETILLEAYKREVSIEHYVTVVLGWHKGVYSGYEKQQARRTTQRVYSKWYERKHQEEHGISARHARRKKTK